MFPTRVKSARYNLAFGYAQMNERTIQAVPARNDRMVLEHSYPIRVQNAIIQHAISSDGLALTATGRLKKASILRILDDIHPIMSLGRETEPGEIMRESDVYKLDRLRNGLIALGIAKAENGKLRVQDGADITPSQLFNQQLLPQVTAILTHSVPMFTRLKFKPFVDYMSAMAAGQDESAALSSVSEHVRSRPQQKSVSSSVITPQILWPFREIGLLTHNPICTTGLWDEVIRIS